MMLQDTFVLKAWLQYKHCSVAEKAFALLLVMLWCRGLLGFVTAVIERLPVVSVLSPYFIPALSIITLLVSLSYISKHISVTEVLVYIGILLLYLLNYIIYTNNTASLDRYVYLFLVGALPFYFVGKSIELSKLNHILYAISIACVVVTSFYFLVFTHAEEYTGSSRMDEDSHNMLAAYQVLPSVLYVIHCFIRDKGLISGVISLMGFVLISAFGARGPLMCLMLFVILVLLCTKKYKHPILSYTIIVAMGGIGLMFLQDILLFMINVTEQLNMSSRIFELAMNEVFFGGEASGDERLFFAEKLGRVMELDGNTWGYGFASSFKYIGSYPHNLLLELRFSFGNYLGIAILAGMILIILRKFIKSTKESGKVFLILLFCVGFVKLFMSGTMLDEAWLYLLLGYCISNNVAKDVKIGQHGV